MEIKWQIDHLKMNNWTQLAGLPRESDQIKRRISSTNRKNWYEGGKIGNIWWKTKISVGKFYNTYYEEKVGYSLSIPYRKASHFFRSFLLPPPSFHLGTTAQRKNVVRRSFWEEWLANDTLRIFSFNHRSIRSFVILHWGCLGTTNLSF